MRKKMMTPQQEAAFRIHRMGVAKALETTRLFLAMAIRAGAEGDEARQIEAPILRELIGMARNYPASALSPRDATDILLAEKVLEIEANEMRDRQIKAALTPSMTAKRVAR